MRYPFRTVDGIPSVPSVAFSLVLPDKPVPAAPVPIAAPAPPPAPAECPPIGVLAPAFVTGAGVAWTAAAATAASHSDVGGTLTSVGQHSRVPGDGFVLLSQVRFGFKLFGLGASESANWQINMASTLIGSGTENVNKTLTALPFAPDFATSVQPWKHAFTGDAFSQVVLHVTNHQLWVEEWASSAGFGGAPFTLDRVITISGTARAVPFSATINIHREFFGF
jgi:hypothetical protein